MSGTLASIQQRAHVGFASRPACTDSVRSLTYDELAVRAALAAGALAATGASHGDRVLLVLQNGCEFVELDHAITGSGLVRVAVSPRLHPREVRRIAEDCEPTIVVADPEWLSGVDLAGLPCAVVTDYENWLAAAEPRDLSTGDPTDLAWLLYTSGTTGAPKGVMHTQASLAAMVSNVSAVLPPLTERDVALHTAPLPHMSGAVAAAVTASGGHNLLRPQFVAAEVLADLVAYQVTVLPLVPTQLHMLCTQTGQADHWLRMIPYAGSTIPASTVRAARANFGEVLYQLYGTSEVIMPITSLPPADHATAETAAGRPPAGVQVRLTEETGEIVVRSAARMSGYWRAPELTAEVLDATGWFRTGDVGRLDEDGMLRIVGRAKDMIVSGGFNVYPREVEDVLTELPGVRSATVVGRQDPQWGEVVVAFLEVTVDHGLTEQSVIAHCHAHLARYKAPKRVMFRAELPRNAVGKVLKRELQ